ncbi:MAG: hypothetical protein ACRDF0_01970, partial [Candidatus Limnocylindria bacterium]
IAKARAIVGGLGFLPLLAALVCSSGAVPALCAIPREWYLALWAGAFGSFIGLTIRLVRERRRFARGAA